MIKCKYCNYIKRTRRLQYEEGISSEKVLYKLSAAGTLYVSETHGRYFPNSACRVLRMILCEPVTRAETWIHYCTPESKTTVHEADRSWFFRSEEGEGGAMASVFRHAK